MSAALTVPQAAKRLGLHRSRVWLLIREGRLRARETVRGYRLDPRDVEAFARLDRRPGRPRKQA